jgi:CRP-like cAMP-binding protein
VKEVNALIRHLKSKPIFELASELGLETLIQRSRVISFTKSTALLEAGHEHLFLYLVLSGQVEMRASNAQGFEMTLALFSPSSMTSWVALFYDTPAERSLVALADTRVLAMPKEAVRALLKSEPKLYPEVLKLEGKRFRASLNRAQLMLNPHKSQRLAALLLTLLEISDQRAPVPKLHITHTGLASTANCSRQSLHESLKDLEQMGLVEKGYRCLYFPSVARLSAFARGELEA